MKNWKKVCISLALIGGLCASLAGCSSSNGGSSSGSVKTVQIALDANVSPYTYTDKNGKYAGYDYETLKMIDDMLPGYKFQYSMVDYDAAAIGLQQGQYDLEAGSKYKTSARAKKFLITDSNYYAAVTMAVRKDSGITSINDMKGKTFVPVPESDGLRQVYLDYMKAHPNAGIKQDTGSALVSIADGLNYVAAGRYDAMIDPPDMFNDVLSKDANLASKITVIADPFTVVGGHFLINQHDKDFYTQVNAAIKKLKANGKLGALSKKWFGEDLIKKYGSMAD